MWRVFAAGTGAGAVCTVVAAVVAGSPGAWGALVGGALVLGFFGLGHAVLTVFRDVAPSLVLVVAMLTYALQAVALLAVYVAFARRPQWSEAVSTDALGLTALGCTLVWTTALVLTSRGARMPVYDAERSGR